MRQLVLIFMLLGFVNRIHAQEFNATVVINAEQTGQPNLQVFKTLTRAVTEFINTTQWTDNEYSIEERIGCSFIITIDSYSNDSFSASIQVQASRPVFGSSYLTTIFNGNDKDFNFRYLEFQPLNYNQNTSDSNLVSVISFYLYTILGIDADTFALNEGTAYYQEAKNIVNNSQNQGSGWRAEGSKQTRFNFNEDLLSGTYEGYRAAMYMYHREGLDVMHANVKEGKQAIVKAIALLNDVHKTRPNSNMMRVFFDAKADEVSNVLSGGPSVKIVNTIQLLNKIAPTYANNWKDIKF